jgi:hypothetical protein
MASASLNTENMDAVVEVRSGSRTRTGLHEEDVCSRVRTSAMYNQEGKRSGTGTEVEARTDKLYSPVVEPMLCVRGTTSCDTAILLVVLDFRSREIADALLKSSVACPPTKDNAASARRDGTEPAREESHGRTGCW